MWGSIARRVIPFLCPWYKRLVAIDPADTITRGLARLGRLASRRPEPGEELLGRDQVLALVRAAPEPVGVKTLTMKTGLHPNTIRGHLDVLLKSDEIRRQLGGSTGPGRPPWLYSAGSTETPLQALSDALGDQLSSASSPELAERTAEQWAEVVKPTTTATDSDSAVAATVDVLNKLGFRANANPVGDRIYITRCPHAPLVAGQPAICEIHGSLLGQLLERSCQSVRITQLDVLARHGVCLVHLARPDLTPARSIAFSDKRQGRSKRSAK